MVKRNNFMYGVVLGRSPSIENLRLLMLTHVYIVFKVVCTNWLRFAQVRIIVSC